MDASGPTQEAGLRLKRLRERLGLTLRRVESLSRRLAEKKQNNDYFISRGWLNNVENGSFTPSIYKIYSLSVIYYVSWPKLLSFLGCRVRIVARDHVIFAQPKTKLVEPS